MEAKVSEAEFKAFKREVQTSMSQLDRSIQTAVDGCISQMQERMAHMENRLQDVRSMVDEIQQIMEPEELSDGTEIYGEEGEEDEISETDTEVSSSSSGSSSTSDSGDSESDQEGEFDDRRPRYDPSRYNEPQPGPYEYPY
jgi:hypothetical protein